MSVCPVLLCILVSICDLWPLCFCPLFLHPIHPLVHCLSLKDISVHAPSWRLSLPLRPPISHTPMNHTPAYSLWFVHPASRSLTFRLSVHLSLSSGPQFALPIISVSPPLNSPSLNLALISAFFISIPPQPAPHIIISYLSTPIHLSLSPALSLSTPSCSLDLPSPVPPWAIAHAIPAALNAFPHSSPTARCPWLAPSHPSDFRELPRLPTSRSPCDTSSNYFF